MVMSLNRRFNNETKYYKVFEENKHYFIDEIYNNQYEIIDEGG